MMIVIIVVVTGIDIIILLSQLVTKPWQLYPSYKMLQQICLVRNQCSDWGWKTKTHKTQQMLWQYLFILDAYRFLQVSYWNLPLSKFSSSYPSSKLLLSSISHDHRTEISLHLAKCSSATVNRKGTEKTIAF